MNRRNFFKVLVADLVAVPTAKIWVMKHRSVGMTTDFNDHIHHMEPLFDELNATTKRAIFPNSIFNGCPLEYHLNSGETVTLFRGSDHEPNRNS